MKKSPTAKYKFNPLKHGFERIQKYPELFHRFPDSKNYYVKVIAHNDFDFWWLVYWYLVVAEHLSTVDEKFSFHKGVYDFRIPCEYWVQVNSSIVYSWLISNEYFAKELLKHLLWTCATDSVENEWIQRYNERLWVEMRRKYKNHYKN